MAPTELLAEQHRDTFRRWLQPLGITVALVIRASLGQKVRNQTYSAIEDGTAEVIVGTHALFQEGLRYHSLAPRHCG